MKYKVGEVVKHKVMKGKFVVVDNYIDNPLYGVSINKMADYAARGEDGKVMQVITEELIKIIKRKK